VVENIGGFRHTSGNSPPKRNIGQEILCVLEEHHMSSIKQWNLLNTTSHINTTTQQDWNRKMSNFKLFKHFDWLIFPPIGFEIQSNSTSTDIKMGQTLEKPALTKDTHTGKIDNYISFGISGMQGFRLSMEDAHNHIAKVELNDTHKNNLEGCDLSFFAVYDGHSGDEAAQYLSTNLLTNWCKELEINKDALLDENIKKIWLQTDANLEKWCVQEGIYPGSTSITSFLKRNGQKVEIIVPNVGDSRSVLCKMGKMEPMSYDHKPTNDGEKRRIIASGGFVDFGRVNGTLAVSRAFGDITYKDNKSKNQEEQAVTAVPEIKRETLDLGEVNASNELSFLILACDGIWDVLKNEEAVQWVKKKLNEQKEKTQQYDLGKLCEEMLDHSVLELDSKDNVSVIVILFGNAANLCV
jgi:protein phosphatase 2C family protein 2/3